MLVTVVSHPMNHAVTIVTGLGIWPVIAPIKDPAVVEAAAVVVAAAAVVDVVVTAEEIAAATMIEVACLVTIVTRVVIFLAIAQMVRSRATVVVN